jgi:hypothetical protein
LVGFSELLLKIPDGFTGRHWIGGEKGGTNTERAIKNGFGAIPYFLEIANVEEAYLIFEKN